VFALMGETYPRTLMELEKRFSSEEACRDYLFALRWPEGFVCPRCGGRSAWAMSRGLWLCRGCRRQVSVTSGTAFQDRKLPLTIWFRAMWYVTSQKNGVSALGLQRVLGLGSYKTAWALLHKLRRAMVRPGRDRLAGSVEVDETYWGSDERPAVGRLIYDKALIAIAAQKDGQAIGRIRLRRLPKLSKACLHRFIAEAVEPGSTVITDGLNIYQGMEGYQHEVIVVKRQAADAITLLPGVHRVASLLKRWLLGTHQGAVQRDYLDYYLDEFTFRFNRRTSASRGKLFYRLTQQAVQIDPVPFDSMVRPQPVGGG
jgi:transposase-like protein